MGILSNIFNKIFHHSTQQQPEPGTATPENQAAPAPVDAAAPAALQNVDLEAVLNELARNHAEKLNWRTSIVDLLKLLDMDSSLTARKALATELNYSGDLSDSATMNIWLHKQVMNKVAANGGKVPADLKD